MPFGNFEYQPSGRYTVRYEPGHDTAPREGLAFWARSVLEGNYFGASIEGRPDAERTREDLQNFLSMLIRNIRSSDSTRMFGGRFTDFFSGKRKPIEIRVDDVLWNLTTNDSEFGRETWQSFEVTQNDVEDYGERMREFRQKSFDNIQRFTAEDTI